MELRMGSPRFFEPEDIGFRDGSSNFDLERDVIGSCTGKGGEMSVREDAIPSKVDEGSI